MYSRAAFAEQKGTYIKNCSCALIYMYDTETEHLEFVM